MTWDQNVKRTKEQIFMEYNCECNMKYCKYKKRPMLAAKWCIYEGVRKSYRPEILPQISDYFFLGRTWSGQRLFSILIFAKQNRILQEWWNWVIHQFMNNFILQYFCCFTDMNLINIYLDNKDFFETQSRWSIFL